jgi:hypothetical protein
MFKKILLAFAGAVALTKAAPSGTKLTEALFFDDYDTEVEMTNSTLGVEPQ